MREWVIVIAFFLLPTLCPAATPPTDSEVIQTIHYSGVIFAPGMLRADDFPVFIPHAHVAYWKPDQTLIDRFENKFVQAIEAANQKIPKGGFHAHEYYTPKHLSADREKHIPDDIYTNPIYDLDFDKIGSWKRQYLGVTVNGKRALLVNFAGDYDTFDLKTRWFWSCPAPPQIFFLLDTQELSFWPFGS